MTLKALFYAYVIGGVTFIPLVIVGIILITVYTSVPVDDADLTKQKVKEKVPGTDDEHQSDKERTESSDVEDPAASALDDLPKTRKGWLTMRRTFEESNFDGSYVTLMRSFLDARSKDPKRSRPKDTWYVVLKGTVLYLYEDEGMTECEAALEVGGHEVVVYPEGLPDGELFAKRNAICLRPKVPPVGKVMPSVTREMRMSDESLDQKSDEGRGSPKRRVEGEKRRDGAREEAFNPATPWFIFVRSNVEMEDWYLSLVHASVHPANSPTLAPLHAVFQPSDMQHLVSTLDSQPDVIPMRWLNALIGRIFFSYYRTQSLETELIRRLMKKLAKVKRPAFLTDIVVTEVAVGNRAPTFSKPMLKELTKEGDAALEVHLQYKGEVRITVEATATINLGARFKSYVVKLTLAAVLRELEGNLLIKVKRPPSDRIWYAFTQTPRMVLDVEPIVSDRQITWSMILNTIEARLKEIIQESVVMPNMDDIAFFESSTYHHRGGIWSDAVRHEKIPVVVEPVVGASASAPDLDELTTAPLSEAEPPLERSRSAEDLRSTASSPVPESTQVAGFASDNKSSDEPTRTRTRSWFSSVGSNDGVALMLASASEDPTSSDLKRGRTTELEIAASGRSRSTPNKSESPAKVGSHLENSGNEEPPDTHEDQLLPGTRRSSSQQSLSSSLRARSEASSTSSSNSPAPSRARNAETVTRSSTGASQTSNPSSFLSTLKSRAGDKQALSNSAKEAMRKLGVNWGGLRKDNPGGGSASDDIPDHGSVESRRRAESNNNFTHRPRASYAEVRAAVAERRGKGGLGQGDGEDGRTSPTPTPEKGKERAAGYFSTTGSTSSSVPSTPLSRLGAESSQANGSPRYLSPPVSRTTTEHTSTSGPEGQDYANPEPRPPSPSLIHTQPMQAKTMSIPGIHASHRGDVMSMGYVAPSPPPESKPKNPAIQSVYRLWKSPVLSGEQQPGTDSAAQSQVQSESTTDRNRDVVPLSLPPSIQSAVVTPPRPPPLPPRSTPASVSRPALDDTRLSSDSREGVPSASEALKTIATKDETKRASLDRHPAADDSGGGDEQSIVSRSVSNDDSNSSIDAGTTTILPPPSVVTRQAPPPLPPRRIQTPA